MIALLYIRCPREAIDPSWHQNFAILPNWIGNVEMPEYDPRIVKRAFRRYISQKPDYFRPEGFVVRGAFRGYRGWVSKSYPPNWIYEDDN